MAEPVPQLDGGQRVEPQLAELAPGSMALSDGVAQHGGGLGPHQAGHRRVRSAAPASAQSAGERGGRRLGAGRGRRPFAGRP